MIGRAAPSWRLHRVWHSGVKPLWDPVQEADWTFTSVVYLGVHGEHVGRAVGIILLFVVVAGKIEAEVGGGAVGRVLLQWAVDLKLLIDDLRQPEGRIEATEPF